MAKFGLGVDLWWFGKVEYICCPVDLRQVDYLKDHNFIFNLDQIENRTDGRTDGRAVEPWLFVVEP